MRKSRDRVAAEFLDWYARSQPDRRVAADALERHLGAILADRNQRPLVVAARAKTLESVRAKLLRKPYARPRRQLTDAVGARIVLYHGGDVDAVAAVVRESMEVRESDSSDKRLALGLREFGYRSYHLVGYLPKAVTAEPNLWSLRGQIFEVQVRSLLEHVWAEIEHQVVYKSGAEWPTEIRRRFASLAGVLELLEHEFDELATMGRGVVENAHADLSRRIDLQRKLDVPYMCAFLELEYPDGLSFRRATDEGSPFPPGIEQLLHLALRRGGVTTTGALVRGLRSRPMQRCVRRYAAAEGIPSGEISHLARLILLVAIRAPAAFRIFFPDFAGDSSIREALEARSRR